MVVDENPTGDKMNLVVILGPTAVGKTELSLNLARELPGEIISADSMQVYKGMDIGTAKVNEEIRREIPHYLIDVVSPEKEFSVAEYQKRTDKIIPSIISKGKCPLLVGGTGMYINAVIDGFMLPTIEPNEELRKVLRKEADTKGNKYVHNKLKEIDPQLAEKIHHNDLRRVIRGIEIYEATGKTKTYFRKKQEQRPPRYNSIKIGLYREREELYHRINLRVEKMIEKGLIEEVKGLYNKYELSKTARQALGYKEIIGYLDNNYSYEEVLRLIKRNTRHFAKRQLSFFKRDKQIIWYNLSDINLNNLKEEIKTKISKKFSSSC